MTSTRADQSPPPSADQSPPLSASAAAAPVPAQPGIVPLTYLSGGGAAVVAAVGLAMIGFILAYALGLLQWISTR